VFRHPPRGAQRSAAIAACVFALCSLVFCLPAAGQDIKIVGPTDPIQAGEPAWLEITGVPDDQGAVFNLHPLLYTNPQHIVPMHGLFLTTTPGTYQITATALIVEIDWEKKTHRTTLIPLSYEVTVEGEAPHPDPPPPVDTKWQVAIFHQSDTRDTMDADQLEVCTGPLFRQELAAKGHGFVGLFDPDERDSKDGIPERVRRFFDAADGHELPVMVMAPMNGGDFRVVPLPANKTEAFKILEGK